MTQVQEKVRFWDRPEIQGAQVALDIWGTVDAYCRMGGRGFPTLDWMNMTDIREVRMEKDGKVWYQLQKLPSHHSDGRLVAVRVVHLNVANLIKRSIHAEIVAPLMRFRYPQEGRMARPPGQIEFRKFWDHASEDYPACVGKAVAQFMFKTDKWTHWDKQMAWHIDWYFELVEQRFLELVARSRVGVQQ